MVALTCPRCRRQTTVSASMASEFIRCYGCGVLMRLPPRAEMLAAAGELHPIAVIDRLADSSQNHPIPGEPKATPSGVTSRAAGPTSGESPLSPPMPKTGPSRFAAAPMFPNPAVNDPVMHTPAPIVTEREGVPQAADAPPLSPMRPHMPAFGDSYEEPSENVMAQPAPSPSPGKTASEYDFLAPPEASNELGRLAGYRILSVLGEGGMGIVFVAEDPYLRRRVAVKVLKPEMATKQNARKRFLREARAVAALDHDQIIKVYAANEDRGVAYMVMPLLQGESLEARIRRESPLPLAEALRIAIATADALDAAHEGKVIHRDIKPANIFLEKRGSLKILDFGLVRPSSAEERGITDSSDLVTVAGAILGTPAYMAPEQAFGHGQVTPQADLYSLGVVLFETTTGVRPFDGQNPMNLITKVLTTKPPVPIALNRAIPQELSDFILQLLEKDVEKRPPSAAVVAEKLRAIERRLQGGNRVVIGQELPKTNDELDLPQQVLPTAEPLSVQQPSERLPAVKPVPPPPPPPRKQPQDAVFAGHSGDVLAAQFDVSGNTILTADSQAVLRTRQTASGRVVQTTPTVNASVSAVAFSQASNRFACATADDSIHLRDLLDATSLHQLRGHSGLVYALAFSPVGTRLASGGRDRSVRIWRVSTGQELVSLRGHTGSITGLAFSPDGKYLASVGKDKIVKLWDLTTGRERSTLLGHTGYIFTVAVSADSRRLATGGMDGLVKVWDADAGRELLSLDLNGYVFAVTFNADGTLLATGGSDAVVRLWDSHTGEEFMQLTGHEKRICCLNFSADGTRLISGSEDGTARVWDLAARFE